MHHICQSSIDKYEYLCYYIDMNSEADSKSRPDTTILRKAGLTESQARGYLALIEYGKLSPAELAEKTGESRTNGYMICEKLEKIGLATKRESANHQKKLLFTPAHPSALETLAERRRKAVQKAETDIKQGIDPLINLFYAATEMPGARTLQGIDGIKEVYADTLKTGKEIYFLRSVADEIDLGLEYLDNYRKQRAELGIHTYGLTPATENARIRMNSAEDKTMLFHRTLLPVGSYTAPVEIDIYGSKVAFIGFGETQMATIIDSPPIAESMRQIMQLLSSQLDPTSGRSQL